MSHLQNPPPDWLTKSYMETNLQNCLQNPHLNIDSIDIQYGSAIGDNFTCQVLRVVVKIKNLTDLTESKVLSLIAKLKPMTLMSEEFKQHFDMFDNEALFFTKLQPELFKVLEKVPNALTYMPKFYFVDKEKNILFMEDLKVDGFVMQLRTKFLNLKQAELVMDALAAFHGAMYCVLQQGDERDKFPPCTWGDPAKPVMLLIKNGALSLKKHMSSYKLPENYQRKLLQIEDDIERGLLKNCIRDGSFNVLCHGDCWKNNVMYHFTNNIADDVKLIDFQGINYGSFAHDLQYFLFLSVSSDVLVSNLDLLLERYYNKLRTVAPDIPGLTLELIKSEFSSRYYFGYLLSVVFRTFVAAETAVDMELIMKGEGLQDNGFNDDTFKKDLHNLLPFFEKVGII